jgi:hypothetical protein
MTNPTTTNLIGRDVDVYFNLHRKCWSIRDRKTRRVVAHADSVVLSDVTFRVSAAGNARVRAEGRKNVHAFARGTVVNFDGEREFFIEDTARVTYNPYKYTTFVDAYDETPVHGARRVWFDGRTVLALDTNRIGCGKVAA